MKKIEKINFDFDPVIKTIPPSKVAFVRVFGNYDAQKIGAAWNKLFGFASKNHLLKPDTEMLGISFGDPEIAQEKTIEYNACISVDENVEADGEIGTKDLMGGKYAVFTYKGAYDKFSAVYDLIFKEWLLKSDYEIRDAEIFDRYLNSTEDNAPEDLLTEIHVPIK